MSGKLNGVRFLGGGASLLLVAPSVRTKISIRQTSLSLVRRIEIIVRLRWMVAE